MKDTRPVNLDLMTIKLPVPAIASILHRISGVLLFLALPILVCLLSESLDGASGFAKAQAQLSTVWGKLVMWAILSATIYHWVAGVRHLIMDLGFGESLKAGRCSAKAALALSAILIVLAGVWLW